ncbi:MAG TPA: glycosyltransferase family 4 protein [Stellaceae bacterium]|nr:glycosyltransferase family 4 protein [Stellaceae bacterium]
MRIAFYAPLKPPDHPVPSGDRRVARLLMQALTIAGHEPILAARLRSRDGGGDRQRQARLRVVGTKLADRYLRRVSARPDLRPDLWLTYHVYYKAPDWIGPRVAAALRIPYVVAEASLAEKRRNGPWQIGHRAAADAIKRADRVIGLNSADREGVLPALARPEHWSVLLPFLDTAPFDAAIARRRAARARVAERWRLDPALPWLVTVAMMRADVKLDSYRLLGAALAHCLDRPFQLLVAGDGPAREHVKAALKPLGDRVRFLGRLEENEVPELLVASDLYAWPAIGEAYGLAILEAQAAGLPVVAGRTGGVGDIVEDGMTGFLVPVGDAAAFAAATAVLIDDDTRRARMGGAARRKIAASHDLAAAARRLDAVLRDLVPAPAR